MPKSKLIPIKISVCGSGEFPIDMLRYDGCFPLSEEDSNLITLTLRTERKWRPTKIVLLKPNGYKHWIPSYTRWKSFGWEVIESEERKDL